MTEIVEAEALSLLQLHPGSDGCGPKMIEGQDAARPRFPSSVPCAGEDPIVWPPVHRLSLPAAQAFGCQIWRYRRIGIADVSGRILFEVDSADSWFEHVAMIDTSRNTFAVVPSGFSGDIWMPGWESDGRIAAIGARLDSTLWRYKPSHAGKKQGAY